MRAIEEPTFGEAKCYPWLRCWYRTDGPITEKISYWNDPYPPKDGK